MDKYIKSWNTLEKILKEQERLLLDVHQNAFVKKFINDDVFGKFVMFEEVLFESTALHCLWRNDGGAIMSCTVPIDEWFGFTNQS